MSKFDDLLDDPFVQRTYLLTLRPFLQITSVATRSADGSLAGIPGAFSGVEAGDRLSLSGFSNDNLNGQIEIRSVSNDASRLWLVGSAAGQETATITLTGSVVRRYSDIGLVTGPNDNPPNT
jgi:hypothetical protein